MDEAGNQLSVFGRRGARPFTLEEQRRLYMRKKADGTWELWDTSLPPTRLRTEAPAKPDAAKPDTSKPATPGAGETPPGPRRPRRPTP